MGLLSWAGFVVHCVYRKEVFAGFPMSARSAVLGALPGASRAGGPGVAQGAASRWRKGAPDSCDARSVSRVAGPGAAATEGAVRREGSRRQARCRETCTDPVTTFPVTTLPVTTARRFRRGVQTELISMKG